MSIHTTIERITPALAEVYLGMNTTNRTMREKHVDRMVSDINEGRWHMNGSSIVFNGDGTLLDGQHRLAAVVKSGVPVDMVVVRGVSKAAMATIDSNISRKTTDVAMMRGYRDTTQLIGTARLLISIKDTLFSAGDRSSTGAIMEFLRMHPHLQDSVAAAKKMQKTMPVTAVAAWHYMAFYLGGYHEDATRAMTVLETGIPYYQNDAIHVFRERALKDRKYFQGNMRNRVNGFWTLALVWNDFRDRIPRQICRIQQTEIKMNGVDYEKL